MSYYITFSEGVTYYKIMRSTTLGDEFDDLGQS